jgi:hypothetical protein
VWKVGADAGSAVGLLFASAADPSLPTSPSSSRHKPLCALPRVQLTCATKVALLRLLTAALAVLPGAGGADASLVQLGICTHTSRPPGGHTVHALLGADAWQEPTANAQTSARSAILCRNPGVTACKHSADLTAWCNRRCQA